jgi:hypothetical protein
MATFYGTKIETNGLIHLLDSSKADGSSTQTINNPIPGSSWTALNYTVGTSANQKTFLSNADATGAGTSHLKVSPNTELTTGSITFIIWFNLKGIPINVGANNNWRGLLCTNAGGTSGSPLTMVLEQGLVINFSTTHTDIYRRYLNNNFSPIAVNATGWQMVAYTYEQSSGNAACYKNGSLVLSGPMTVDTVGGSPTTSGTALQYNNYTSGPTETGFRIYGGTNTAANPTGNGICPGEVSNVMIYNRALSTTEIFNIFNAYRGRYGI